MKVTLTDIVLGFPIRDDGYYEARTVANGHGFVYHIIHFIRC